MSAPEVAKGDQVEVTVRGEVSHVHPRGAVVVAIPGVEHADLWISKAALGADAVTVTRTVPALPVQWPPRPGDVWTLAKGEPWFGIATPYYDEGVIMLSSADRSSAHTIDTWWRMHGPATLKYRAGYEMPAGWYDRGGDLAVQHAPGGVTTEQVVTAMQDATARAKADRPGGWMQPGESGSAYVPAAEDASDLPEQCEVCESTGVNCTAHRSPRAVPDPDVEMVAPAEVVVGDTIALPIRQDGLLPDTLEVTDIDTGGIETTFYYEGAGAEHAYTVHHGGAVARVRKAGAS